MGMNIRGFVKKDKSNIYDCIFSLRNDMQTSPDLGEVEIKVIFMSAELFIGYR
jgi:hypothetical protein